MARSRVTLADIARKTGVSLMTVSYALRNSLKISEPTRARIRRTAERMGYVPDPDLVKLMTRVRMNHEITPDANVAVLDLFSHRNRFTADPYTNALVAGVEDRLKRLGYQLIRFRLSDAEFSPRRATAILHSRGVQGVVLPPFPTETAQCDLEWAEMCAVCTEEKFHQPALHKVIPHHYNNMILVLQRLWAMGYRRPGLVSCRNSLERDNYAWFGAFYSFFADRHGTDWVPALPIGVPVREMVAWYEQHRPDAIIVTEDFLIRHFIEATGLRVPEDVGVACLATDFSELSGVKQRPGLIGSAAADMLTAHIIRNERGIPATPKAMMIDGDWHDAGTLRAKKVTRRR